METKLNLIIQGTHCPACKGLIEDVSSEIQGVIYCNVNFETGQTQVTHDDKFNIEMFKREIESLGEYKVVLE